MRTHFRSTRLDARSIRILALAFAMVLGPALAGCDAFTDADQTGITTAVTDDASARPGTAPAPTGPDCITGVQSSGAFYEICLPGGEPSGTLVVYAHGFVIPQQPLALPNTEEGGINVREFVTGQGLDYAATSYYANGLIVPQKGVKDLRELVTAYTQLYGRPETVLLLGFSNGTLLATHALEQHPGLFDGAFASCGVHGSYTREVDYLADIFVVFEHFFPDALDELFGIPAGGPEGINPAFLGALTQAASGANVPREAVLALHLAGRPDLGVPGVLTHPDNAAFTGQLLGVIKATPEIGAAFDTPAEGVQTVVRGVIYNVLATNNAIDVLGGLPYENTDREYASPFGAAYDAALNETIDRYTADRNARAQLRARFETSGRLRDPFVALHTPRDPTAPFWQEDLYLAKVSDPLLYEVMEVSGKGDGYGHCTFEPDEIAIGFEALLADVAGVAL